MQILLPPPVAATHPTDQNIKRIFVQWFKALGINHATSPPSLLHAAFCKRRSSWGWGNCPSIPALCCSSTPSTPKRGFASAPGFCTAPACGVEPRATQGQGGQGGAGPKVSDRSPHFYWTHSLLALLWHPKMAPEEEHVGPSSSCPAL